MLRTWLAALSLLLMTSAAGAQPTGGAAPLPAPTAAAPTTRPTPTTTAPSRPQEVQPEAQPAAPASSGFTGSALDQSTPRQTVAGFLRAVEQGDLGLATRYLELRGLKWRLQTPTEAAQQLSNVLERRVWLQLTTISDRPEGNPADGEGIERIAHIEIGQHAIPITLVRTRRGNADVWLFAAATVAQIPELSEALGTSSWVLDLVPDDIENNRLAGLWVWQWVGLAVAVFLGLPLGYLFSRILMALLERFALRTPARWDDSLVMAATAPVRFSVSWITMGLTALSLDLPPNIHHPLRLVVTTPLIVATGWFLVRVIRVSTAVYLRHVPHDQELNTRGLRTQLVILRKIGSVTVGLITFAIALMQFDVVRSVGWSLLASAGVAGVALGFAAQKSLGAIVAGLQLSITQPIRLGDAIIMRGEWGVVEEITITWARVKLWDERRLIVPIDKFLTEIFENWSRPGDTMTGIIEIAVDPTAPVEAIRAELARLADDHPAHDGRECVLQLIDLSENRALLRARVSTDQMDQTFALRCDLRERLMVFLQGLDGGRYLARRRYERIEPTTSGDPAPQA